MNLQYRKVNGRQIAYLTAIYFFLWYFNFFVN